MQFPLWQQASWWKALTLAERLLSPSRNDLPTYDNDVLALAKNRLTRWQELAVFQSDIAFDERLALNGLSEGRLLALLAETPEQLRERFPAQPEGDWLKQLTQAYEDQYSTENQPFELPIDERSRANMVLCESVAPLLRQAHHDFVLEVEHLLHQYPHTPVDLDTTLSTWLALLVGRISLQLIQTLVLEVNVARLEGCLQGETPQERFHNFIQQLADGAMLNLLEEYPVLARHLLTTIKHWHAYGIEIFTHLGRDWIEICQTFGLADADPGPMTSIKANVGDAHRRGRCVVILTFRSGLRVVYKPKSLTVDEHFQTLLAWLNTCGYTPQLPTIKIINKESYGWSEYVEAHGCQAQEEVERFYERQGAYLALLSVFEATDFHFENIIASGEYPVLIDLEALLHPHQAMQNASGFAATQAFQHSVLRVGLLPEYVYQEGFDASGMGGRPAQMIPYSVPGWEEVGTDMMHIARQTIKVSASENRPSLHGQDVSLLDYEKQVIGGFQRMYRLLTQQRETLRTTYLPLFLGAEIRVLLRPTNMYVVLRRGSLHPNCLRDAHDRERFLDRLFLASAQFPARGELIQAERDDLLQGDIPFFTTSPVSRDLYTSRGKCIQNFFTETSATMMMQHIDRLSEEDMQRQTWLINASFAGVRAAEQQYIRRENLPRPLSYPLADPERLIAGATKIADHLLQQAHYNDDRATWLTLKQTSERGWKMSETDASLYEGTTGIAFFLAYLGALTGEDNYTTSARMALNSLYEGGILRKNTTSPGAFDGLASLLYLFTHLGILWREPALLVKAEALLNDFIPMITQDHSFDIMSGAAGCICALLGFAQVSASTRALDLAVRFGKYINKHAQPVGAGLAWASPHAAQPLAGFSHGTAGIAYSLFWLSSMSGEKSFREVAEGALRYERELFSPSKRNWPDLRKEQNTEDEATTDQWMIAWCHGAAGIGLSRLGILPYDDTPAIRAEIAIACETTLSYGGTWNHALCHGAMGNLETLVVARQRLPDIQLGARIAAIATQLLAEGETFGWVTGVPLAVEIPGLMTGIAGIGYELLRVAAPNTLPSVLLLAPPLQSTEMPLQLNKED